MCNHARSKSFSVPLPFRDATVASLQNNGVIFTQCGLVSAAHGNVCRDVHEYISSESSFQKMATK